MWLALAASLSAALAQDEPNSGTQRGRLQLNKPAQFQIWRTITLGAYRGRLGRPPIAPALEKRIREALATPGRPGVRVIAKQFGVNPGTVQRISRPFEQEGVAL
jgi:hypothetical protein